MIAETSFITLTPEKIIKINLFKSEAIDRLDSIVCDLPKYKKKFDELIVNFTVNDMLLLMRTIYRDPEFICLRYYRLYNKYFYEIEHLIYKYITCR